MKHVLALLLGLAAAVTAGGSACTTGEASVEDGPAPRTESARTAAPPAGGSTAGAGESAMPAAGPSTARSGTVLATAGGSAPRIDESATRVAGARPGAADRAAALRDPQRVDAGVRERGRRDAIEPRGGNGPGGRDAAVAAAVCEDGRCPLAAWMKTYAAAAMIARDFASLAAVLAHVEALAPSGYANWASIAGDGAAAARVEDMDAVRAACRSCHAQYKARYKRDLHDRLL